VAPVHIQAGSLFGIYFHWILGRPNASRSGTVNSPAKTHIKGTNFGPAHS
jgi:hypothetical protein